MAALRIERNSLSAKNMRAPSVYLYDVRDGKHYLYLGDYTTSEGLRLVPVDSQILLRHIYADGAPELPDHFARPQSIDTTVGFIDTIHSIVDFECAIDAGATLSSHDDCECHFRFVDRDCCENVLRCAVSPKVADTLWNLLLTNHGKYLTIDDRLVVATYDTFEDYLATLK